jgi:predicted Zn-dependent peptidase
VEFRKHTLANGFTVVAECNDAAHTTATGFFVNTGARDEDDAVWGVSHFLEHMVFKGTLSRSADDVNREFDEMGADYNAYTSEENTVYYATVLPEHQSRSVGLLADILRPAIREADFTTEKQVILEEIQMYEDQPPFGADDRVKALHFAKHPLGRSVLGTIKSVGDLAVDQMREYFRRRYSADKITLVACGRVAFDKLVGDAERLCGSWPAFPAPRETPRHGRQGGFTTMHKESATQEYVLALANGPSATDEDRFAAKLLATVVGDDSGSRLYWELVDPGYCESASLSHHGYQGTGVFMTYFSCDPERAEANLKIVADVVSRLERDGVTAVELAQAKSKVASRVVLGSERPRGRLFTVGSNWINRQTYRSVQDDLNSIEAVTLDDITAVLRKYPFSGATTIAVGPLKEVKSPR